MTKRKHIDQTEATRAKIRRRVMKTLPVTEFKYNQIQFECGISYLNDRRWQEVKKSKIFWGWWKTQYAIIDIMFLDSYLPEFIKGEPSNERLIEAYELFHRDTAFEHVPTDGIIDKIIKEIENEAFII